MTESKTYAYKKGAAGEPIEATVFYKPNGSSPAKPIAVYYHGGNFIVGTKDMLSPQYVEKLLSLGFGAVVSANYRLAPTISAYEGPVTDSLDAFNWAQNELPKQLAQEANVQLDGNRVATWGHSAGGTIALLTASAPKPPRAIADFFGLKYLREESYHNPLPLPPLDLPSAAFQDRVFEQVPPPSAAPPPFGPKGIDVSSPRNAWMISKMKTGTFLQSVQPDGDYDKIDPALLFDEKFPPTYFGHGGADSAVNVEFTKRAYGELKGKGVETELTIIEGAQHGFDLGKKAGDPEYEAVIKGFEFLIAHV